jgi:hypothetical protein
MERVGLGSTLLEQLAAWARPVLNGWALVWAVPSLEALR